MGGGEKICKVPLDEGLYCGDKIEAIRKKLIGGTFSYAKHTKVIRREVLLEQVEHSYQGQLRDFEDWLTMIQIFNKAESVYIVKKAYYHYIQYSNSVSKSGKSYQLNYQSLKTVLDFLAESTYSKLDKEDICSIRFYGMRSLLNRCINIKDWSLANEIIGSQEFRDYIGHAEITKVEKYLLYAKNVHLYYCCWWLKNRLLAVFKHLSGVGGKLFQ